MAKPRVDKVVKGNLVFHDHNVEDLSDLSFPLSPSLGGTGIDNGTNTLTVPSSGTVVLLNYANAGQLRVSANSIVIDSGQALFVNGAGDANWSFGKDASHNINVRGASSGTRAFQVLDSANANAVRFHVDFGTASSYINGPFTVQPTTSSVALTVKANGNNILTSQNAAGTSVLTISSVGATLVKPSTNSTTAFTVQNASGTAVLNCDTTNLRVAVGAAKTAKFAVTGHANTTTAWIQAYSSQTSNVPILSVKENTATPIMEIYKDANGGPSGMMVDIGSQFVTQGADAGGGISLGLTMNVDFSSLSGQSQASYMGLYQAVYLGDYGMGVNYVGSSVGTTASVSTGFSTVTNPNLTGTVYNVSDTSASGTFSLLRGALFTATGQSGGVTYTELTGAEFLIGTIGNTAKMYGFKISPFIDVIGTTKTLTDLYAIGITRWGSLSGYANGNVTNAYGLHIETPQTGGTITNAYGVYIQNMAGTNKYAIKTGTGLVDFGDTVNSTGYLVSGTAGIDATVALAKITAGGTDGSMTVSKGIVTAYTAPT